MPIKIKKTDWDLTPLIKKESEVQPELDKISKAHASFVAKWKSNSQYLTNPNTLKEALDELEKLETNFGTSGNSGFYYHLKSEIDQANSETKAKLNKVEEFEKNIANQIRFFTLNLGKIPKEKQKEFLSSKELQNYKHFLERIFEKAKHRLSEEEEKIMALKQSVAHDSWERLTSSLIAKQEKEITIEDKKETKNFSQLLSLTEDKNKKTRHAAAKAFNQILSQYSEVAEQEINSILMNAKINNQIRKFARPDSARHLKDDISTQTVDTLIKSVSENFKISQDFYNLKAKLFKVPKIKYYERAVPYGERKTKYPYEQSINLVYNTFSSLDKEFGTIAKKFVENSQVDVFPKKSKKNGAFCSHQLKIQPVYIMLNYDDSLKDITTIAHEFGHGINAELMNKSQNSLNIGTPKSTAEVASTFMEDFVLQELLKTANEEEKLIILMEKLSGDISTIFRQTAFYNFEFELHTLFGEKGYLSEKEIGQLFIKHMSSYMGSAVDVSDAANWWVYVPHFRYLFYVYSYASGLLISKALQNKVRQESPYIKKVKEFLSAGTSDSPENIFKSLGIDITKKEFWLSGIKEVQNLLKEAEALAKKLNKIKSN